MPDARHDQAEGLRRLFDRRRAHVVTVAAGMAGVGATGAAINLGAALAARGHRTLVIDENRGPANVSGSLGLRARRDLRDVVAGECPLEDALLAGPGDVSVLPAAAAARALAMPPEGGQQRLEAALARLNERFDIMLIDARCGGSNSLSALAGAVQDVVIVCSAAGAAITKSYALIKRLHRSDGWCRYRVLMNRVPDEGGARLIFGNLERVSRRHLGTPLEFLGHVPRDERARRAAGMMQPVVTAFPSTPAATAFRRSAEAVAGSAPARAERGDRDGFLHRLLTAVPAGLSMEAA